jgi:protein-S-isoprenylcysteine O-methyltransferase Ste14
VGEVKNKGEQLMKIDIKKIAIDCGSLLFKVRSFTPIPLILFMLFCFHWELENPIFTWSCGMFFLIGGESMRLLSLRYMGKFSRTRKKKGRMLVTVGPYACIRNPLYWGNLLILIGFTVMSELVWLIPVIVILFFIQYQCIVLWEEDCLKEFFPLEAEDYFLKVPRWLPNWRGLRNCLQHFQLPSYDWVNVFKREKSTLQGLIMGCIAMMVKEFF